MVKRPQNIIARQRDGDVRVGIGARNWLTSAAGDSRYIRRQGGDTASRPENPLTYEMYFDTDLGLPIWHDGTNWVDATGATV